MKIKRNYNGKEYTYDRKSILVDKDVHNKLKEKMKAHGFTTIPQYITHLVNEG